MYITENLVYILEHGSAALFSECRCLKMLHCLEHGITTAVRRSFEKKDFRKYSIFTGAGNRLLIFKNTALRRSFEYKDFKIPHLPNHGSAALF